MSYPAGYRTKTIKEQLVEEFNKSEPDFKNLCQLLHLFFNPPFIDLTPVYVDAGVGTFRIKDIKRWDPNTIQDFNAYNIEPIE